MGRFLSEDPIGFASGDENWFRFTWNNPRNYRDPSGLAPAAEWNSVKAAGIATLTAGLTKIYLDNREHIVASLQTVTNPVQGIAAQIACIFSTLNEVFATEQDGRGAPVPDRGTCGASAAMAIAESSSSFDYMGTRYR